MEDDLDGPLDRSGAFRSLPHLFNAAILSGGRVYLHNEHRFHDFLFRSAVKRGPDRGLCQYHKEPDGSEPVIDELQLDLDYEELSELVTVTNPDSTHIIEMQVVCGDPELSRNITNALMNISIDQIYQIIGSSEPTVIDYSIAESVQDVTPSIFRYMVIGGLLGAVAVCAVLIIRMLMDSTIKSEEDVEKYLGLPILAAVPYYREGKGK